MQDAEGLSLERIQALLEASEEVRFEGKRRQEVYDWMTRLMRQQEYRKQGKACGDCCGATWVQISLPP